jgi:hypothetical protein
MFGVKWHNATKIWPPYLMTRFHFKLLSTVIYLLINASLLVLTGCTTMVAQTSIDPYTSNYEKRGMLESLAAEYCKAKQSAPGRTQATALPDYRFTTDGCSRWLDKPWLSCCVVHDITYWCGGSDDDREQADQFIMQCVNQKAALVGGIMYPGVRIGGSPWLPTPWRWGYGWKEWPKGYQKASNHPSVDSILKKLHILGTVEQQLR